MVGWGEYGKMENYLEIIGEWVNPDMSLSNKIPFVLWELENELIELNGIFTADELRALAHYMDPYGESDK
jgi:hypothetical protein